MKTPTQFKDMTNAQLREFIDGCHKRRDYDSLFEEATRELNGRSEPLYYPCAINHRTGKISKKLACKPMTREKAEDFLKRHLPRQWLNGEALPQPANHHYFK